MARFRTYNQDQLFLLPPSLKDRLKENHIARFISDVVDSLDLSAIINSYKHKDERGYPAYHPAMMLKILIYGYSRGIYSSRKIAAACEDDVAFRVLSSNQHPDHDSITRFRRKHLKEFKNLFLKVLELAEEAGLVKLGHVSLDGSKIKANASKNKAMSYGRMIATVIYEYQVNGVHCTNNGIEPHDTKRGGFLGLFGLFDMDSSEYGSPEIDKKYPVGSKVLVHYDRSNPKRACLELHFLPFYTHP